MTKLVYPLKKPRDGTSISLNTMIIFGTELGYTHIRPLTHMYLSTSLYVFISHPQTPTGYYTALFPSFFFIVMIKALCSLRSFLQTSSYLEGHEGTELKATYASMQVIPKKGIFCR
jgi:hypothetical protein